jgi:hypothetical protein
MTPQQAEVRKRNIDLAKLTNVVNRINGFCLMAKSNPVLLNAQYRSFFGDLIQQLAAMGNKYQVPNPSYAIALFTSEPENCDPQQVAAYKQMIEMQILQI